MKALIVSTEDDTGGVGVALAQALNRHTDWEAREVHGTQNYIDYPTDILWPPGTPMPSGLADLFAAADVIHVMERWDAVDRFAGWLEKPLVIHHHGTIFREWNTQPLLMQTRGFGAVPIVSTIDLTLIDPNAEWLPNPCNLRRLRSFRKKAKPHDGLLATHSPTNRSIKGTDKFIAAAAQTDWEIDLIERVDWTACLRRKARADVVFDQLAFGYGLSGIEAMAMGIPFISGATDRRVTDLLYQRFGNLPFFLAGAGTLATALQYLRDPDARAASAAVGTEFVERFHDEAVVARQLVGIYERALEMRRG